MVIRRIEYNKFVLYDGLRLCLFTDLYTVSLIYGLYDNLVVYLLLRNVWMSAANTTVAELSR